MTDLWRGSPNAEFGAHERLCSLFAPQFEPQRPVIRLLLDFEVKKRTALPFRRNPFRQFCERNRAVLKTKGKSVGHLNRFNSSPLDFVRQLQVPYSFFHAKS